MIAGFAGSRPRLAFNTPRSSMVKITTREMNSMLDGCCWCIAVVCRYSLHRHVSVPPRSKKLQPKNKSKKSPMHLWVLFLRIIWPSSDKDENVMDTGCYHIRGAARQVGRPKHIFAREANLQQACMSSFTVSSFQGILELAGYGTDACKMLDGTKPSVLNYSADGASTNHTIISRSSF